MQLIKSCGDLMLAFGVNSFVLLPKRSSKLFVMAQLLPLLGMLLVDFSCSMRFMAVLFLSAPDVLHEVKAVLNIPPILPLKQFSVPSAANAAVDIVPKRIRASNVDISFFIFDLPPLP